MRKYFARRALVGGAVEPEVTITCRDGTIVSVEAGTEPDGATVLGGVTLPGFANAHSHAFHRALRGRTQTGEGSFWTWRNLMYDVAGRLTPDTYHQLSRAVFAEMLVAGFTLVGEFHYVHHRADGTPHDEPNAMADAIISAAADVGIRLTLLDTLYLHGGLGSDGHRRLAPGQTRFSDGTVDDFLARHGALESGATGKIGAAIHSIRAVDPDSMAVLGDTVAGPLHAHVSEQPEENEQCLAAFGCTPTELLDRTGVLSERFTAVHATHLTHHDLELLGSSGAGACLCPTTERDLADGIGLPSRLAQSGAGLAVGSDSHAVIDPFEEIRGVELNERLSTNVRGATAPLALIAAGTSGGYRTLGWEAGGRIEAGGLADFTVVGLDSVRLAGHDPDDVIPAVVFAAGAADVTDVVVGGEHLVSGGEHRSVDVRSALSEGIREVYR